MTVICWTTAALRVTDSRCVQVRGAAHGQHDLDLGRAAVLQRVCDSEAAAAASSAAAAAVAGQRSYFGAGGLSGGGRSSRRSSACLEALELEPVGGGNGGGDASGVLRNAGGGAALSKRPVELSKLLSLLADAEINHRCVVLRPRASPPLLLAPSGATALINVWSTAILVVLVQLVIARAESFFDGRHFGLVLLLMHWASCGWRLVGHKWHYRPPPPARRRRGRA